SASRTRDSVTSPSSRSATETIPVPIGTAPVSGPGFSTTQSLRTSPRRCRAVLTPIRFLHETQESDGARTYSGRGEGFGALGPAPRASRTCADRRRDRLGARTRPALLRHGPDGGRVRPRPAAAAAPARRCLADVSEPFAVILPQITIARAHWILGALFLAIIVEEYVPLVGRDGGRVRSRSLLVPWALILGAVGVWATTVFADI